MKLIKILCTIFLFSMFMGLSSCKKTDIDTFRDQVSDGRPILSPVNEPVAEQTTEPATASTPTATPSELMPLSQENSTINYVKLVENFVLLYNEDQEELAIYNEINDTTHTVCDDGLRFTIPQIAPSKTSIAFIYPFEFEELGYVYVYNVIHNTKNKFDLPAFFYSEELENIKSTVSHDFYMSYLDKTPHELIWLNDSILLVKMGNLSGTIGHFSEVFYLNVETGKFGKLITISDSFDYIEKMDLKDNKLEIIVIKYSDNLMPPISSKIFELEYQIINELINKSESIELDY